MCKLFIYSKFVKITEKSNQSISDEENEISKRCAVNTINIILNYMSQLNP